MLPDGYSDIPAGKLAAVVTSLEMTAPPAKRADPEQQGIALEHFSKPEVAWYRDLYSRIGADWLWASRLEMPESELGAIIQHPDVEIYAVIKEGRSEGLLELDFRRVGCLRACLLRPDAGCRRKRHRALADEQGDRACLVSGRAWAHSALLGPYLHA